MSGTRSRFRRAQATEAGGAADEALLIVAHGDRGGLREDRLAREIAARLRRSGRYAAVEVGLIRGEPSLEEAARRLPPGAFRIYPLFMSEGYYVQKAIPERLGLKGGKARAAIMETPLGLDPALPGTVLDAARRTAQAAGLDAARATLLLVAHGSSKSSASADAARALAGAMEKSSPFRRIEVAFLEETPFLPDALAALEGPAVVLGLFAGEGMHGAEDLPQAIAATGRDDLHLAPPLAREGALIDLVCARLGCA